ncbi:TetR/AcrR family transcriptional regulator [Gordonia sp. (in: high G+C Gram-positive bacteria)]|uniref:TetR/AcrR family transcriptional regulator n=1 Tax=Gordonia sp. (in: high G+C Gram-positive bacteria) TaxID=84139 RepID=UPI0039E704A7
MFRTTASPDEQREAILTAAQSEFERFGLRKSSVDDMAREAGVSRSTFYRRFPNKESLIVGVLGKIGGRQLEQLEAATRDCTPEQAVVEAFCAAMGMFTGSPFLRALALEGSSFFPHNAVVKLRRNLVDEMAVRVAKVLKRCGSDRDFDDLVMVSDTMVRLVLSHVETPSSTVGLDDPAAARRFGERYLAPLVADHP